MSLDTSLSHLVGASTSQTSSCCSDGARGGTAVPAPGTACPATPLIPDDNRIADDQIKHAVNSYLLLLRSSPTTTRTVAAMVMHYGPHLNVWAAERICAHLGDCPERREALALLNTAITPAPTPFDHVKINADASDGTATVDVCADGSAHRRYRPSFKIDGEIGRLAAVLGLAEALRVWLIARSLDPAGQGWAYVKDIKAALEPNGVEAGDRALERWIPLGMREKVLFRGLDEGRLWYVMREKVGPLVTALACDPERTYRVEKWEKGKRTYVTLDGSALVETNLPGAPEIYLSIDGSLQEFKARLYAAWFNAMGHHVQNISRFTLSALWGGATPRTLRQWEKLAGIEVEKNYATFTDDELIPFHAEPILRENGTVGAQARLSNNYDVPLMNQHPRRGQANATRAKALEVLEAALSRTPESHCDGAGNGEIGYLRGRSRLHFSDPNGHTGKALKALRRHLKKEPDDKAAHYVRLGTTARDGAHLYEQVNNPQLCTGSYSRADAKTEREFWENHCRGDYAFWREQGGGECGNGYAK